MSRSSPRGLCHWTALPERSVPDRQTRAGRSAPRRPARHPLHLANRADRVMARDGIGMTVDELPLAVLIPPCRRHSKFELGSFTTAHASLPTLHVEECRKVACDV